MGHCLRYEFVIDAPVAKVWSLWSTESGLLSFFAPKVNVEFTIGGAFEILFNPEAEPGYRGAEGMMIMALEPEKLISFTWNSPPTLPTVRNQMTAVHVYMQAEGQATKLLFIHSGFGYSEEWQKSKDYFHRAWGDIVLPKLKHAAEVGPITW